LTKSGGAKAPPSTPVPMPMPMVKFIRCWLQLKATPSGILISGPGKVQNWMRAGGFGHYAIIFQASCKDGRHHISAVKTYLNYKVSEILHYYIHTCRYEAPNSMVLLIYKTFATH